MSEETAAEYQPKETYAQSYLRELAKEAVAALEPVWPDKGREIRKLNLEDAFLRGRSISLTGAETEALSNGGLLVPLELSSLGQTGPGWSEEVAIANKKEKFVMSGTAMKYVLQSKDRKKRPPAGTMMTLTAAALINPLERDFNKWILKEEARLRAVPPSK